MKVVIEEFATGNPIINAEEIDDARDLDVLKSIITIMHYQNKYYTTHNYKYAETLEQLLELKESWEPED